MKKWNEYAEDKHGNILLNTCKISKRKSIQKGWGINLPDVFLEENKENTVGEVFIFHEEEKFRIEPGEVATVKALYFNKGKKLSLHFHVKKKEIFFMAKGSLIVTLISNGEEDKFLLTQGESIYIPPGMVHQMEGVEEENIMIEVSTKDHPSDSYRIKKGD